MKTLRFVFFAVVGALLVVGVCVAFLPLLGKRSERAAERDRLKAENDAMERHIGDLRRRQAEFESNPEFVELQAHKEGMVRSSERVFDFSEVLPRDNLRGE